MSTPRRAVRATLALGTLLALVAPHAAPARATSTTPAAGEVVVLADGMRGLTLEVPARATAGAEALRVDLLDQPAAMVQLVPRRCARPSDAGWCPVAAAFAVHESRLGADNTTTFVDSNEGNVLPGLLDVYVLSRGPVRVTVRLDGLSGRRTVTADRTVTGVLAPLPRTCAAGDCRRASAGARVESVGTLGSAYVHAWSRTAATVDPAGLAPNVVQSKSNVACGYSEDRGASIDPADHDGGCDALPRTDDPEQKWRSNAVNYLSAATPVSGPVVRFGAYAPSATGRFYLGYRSHAVSADDELAPGRATHGAWAAWVRAGFR